MNITFKNLLLSPTPIGAPHLGQNLAPSSNLLPQFEQNAIFVTSDTKSTSYIEIKMYLMFMLRHKLVQICAIVER